MLSLAELLRCDIPAFNAQRGERPSLRGADLRGLELADAVIEGADLTGADLSGARCSVRCMPVIDPCA